MLTQSLLKCENKFTATIKSNFDPSEDYFLWEWRIFGGLGDWCSFTNISWECQFSREFTIKGSAIEVIYIFFCQSVKKNNVFIFLCLHFRRYASNLCPSPGYDYR